MMTRARFWSPGIVLVGFAGAGFLTLMSTMMPAFAYGAGEALIMGGSGNPDPRPGYIEEIDNTFIQHCFVDIPCFQGFDPQGVSYPAQFWPFTGLFSLTFDQTNERGAVDLNNAIMAATADPTNQVVAFGYSQSTAVATLEKRFLDDLPPGQAPNPDQLSFMLLENLNRPNGGILARFDDLYIPLLNISFNGATPNDLYPTVDIGIQYDAAADFPKYPINLLADLNAMAGNLLLHFTAPEMTTAELDTALIEPVSAADLHTTYLLIPTEDLPLLAPLRLLPFVGPLLADLIQPDLRVLIELGYDRSAPQDVFTPAELFPHIDLHELLLHLYQGTVTGINDALQHIGLPPLLDFLPNSYLPPLFELQGNGYTPVVPDPSIVASLAGSAASTSPATWLADLGDQFQHDVSGLTGSTTWSLFSLLSGDDLLGSAGDPLGTMLPDLAGGLGSIGTELAAFAADPTLALSALLG